MNKQKGKMQIFFWIFLSIALVISFAIVSITYNLINLSSSVAFLFLVLAAILVLIITLALGVSFDKKKQGDEKLYILVGFVILIGVLYVTNSISNFELSILHLFVH